MRFFCLNTVYNTKVNLLPLVEFQHVMGIGRLLMMSLQVAISGAG